MLCYACQSGSSIKVRHFFIVQKEKAEDVGYPAVRHEHSDSISMQLSLKAFKAHTLGASLFILTLSLPKFECLCICAICLQVMTKQHVWLAKLTRKFELRMGFLFLSGGDTVFCSIFINRHVCLCITQFMNACLNSTHLLNLLMTGFKTN